MWLQYATQALASGTTLWRVTGRHGNRVRFIELLRAFNKTRAQPGESRMVCNWRGTEYEQLLVQMMYKYHVK